MKLLTFLFSAGAVDACVQFYAMPLHFKLSWKQAVRHCRRLGGELSSFDNAEEFELYKNRHGAELIVERDGEWAGYKRSRKGHFVDLDGNTPSFTNWNQHEPNNSGGDEDCAMIYGVDGEYKWNDIECNNKHRNFSCKFDHPVYCEE